MNCLNVCFVGVGSIGKRHIRNLHIVCEKRGIEVHIDALRRPGSKPLPADLGLRREFTDLSEIKEPYDIVFITNPTENHIETMEQMKPYGKHFFIEKPISSVHQIPELEKFQKKEGAVYYVACPLRYCSVLQYLKAHLEEYRIVSTRCMSTSYLPDWRPNIDYRENYSAHKDQGGGVDIDLIHEWDYITCLFGMPKEVKSLIGKKSDLEIDSNDYAIYIADYADKILELHLDYFGRKTLREVMLFTADETIVGDIEQNEIRFLKSGKTITFNEEQDDYQNELCHFLDMIEGKAEADNDVEQAVKILKLTQGEL